MSGPATDHRRAIAERNIGAILDAAEGLLERRSPAGIANVASEAGVSRVTVYAHFPTREAILEAVVERAVQRVSAALDAAEPDKGPALEALDRVVAICWRELSRSPALAQAAAEQLSPGAMDRAHEAGYGRIGSLIERGRQEGEFRNDLPTSWLVTCCFALMHACGDQVRAGRLDETTALDVLTATLRDLLSRSTS
jgi:TetR/AcrR family transcriptional regulator, mexCD-oprJ operon repressor